jgi:hypothetical protein
MPVEQPLALVAEPVLGAAVLCPPVAVSLVREVGQQHLAGTEPDLRERLHRLEDFEPPPLPFPRVPMTRPARVMVAGDQVDAAVQPGCPLQHLRVVPQPDITEMPHQVIGPDEGIPALDQRLVVLPGRGEAPLLRCDHAVAEVAVRGEEHAVHPVTVSRRRCSQSHRNHAAHSPHRFSAQAMDSTIGSEPASSGVQEYIGITWPSPLICRWTAGS